ncbi:MAG TPA: SCP2 sterol-binding domain-containing protein [Acidimicrobiales bacterium]|jgi:putative sterol carrier protein|nr:SCP2 sterol-binding domain-containing protein [Acidimicrobiales bacterium]
MAKWLTQEWLDESTELAKDQPVRPGASARLQYRIVDGPDGDVSYYWIVVDGRLVENRLGELADAEVTLTESYEDAKAMQQGLLDANTAFMQGKIKVTGDVAKLMSLLPITMSPEFQAFQQAVLAITEF